MEHSELCKLARVKTVFGGIDCADDFDLCSDLALIEKHRIGDADTLAKSLHKAIQDSNVFAGYDLGKKVGILLGCVLHKLHAEGPIRERNARNAKLASAVRAKRSAKTRRLYDDINRAVADRVKKRGKHKQPSLTEIRRRVAAELGVAYSRVLDAQRGGRKK